MLIMGTNDLAKELRAGLVPGRHPLLWGLGRVRQRGPLAGKVILDGVYNDITDPEGFAAECRQGAEMGFDGKTLIHPDPARPGERRPSPRAEAEIDARTSGHRGVRGGHRRGQGRDHSRRQDDRAPARGQRPSIPRHRGGDRGTVLTDLEDPAGRVVTMAVGEILPTSGSQR